MRRSDREITDEKRIDTFIRKEHIIRVAFYDDGDIYIVPVNYGYAKEEGKHVFYFHGAKAGRKYDLAMGKPKVGFEIDGSYELITGEMACDHSATFQSVIGTGRLSVLSEMEEKQKGLGVIMKQVTGTEVWKYDEGLLQAVAVFKLEVEKLSCKAK